jgi:hypothetical protein
VKALLYAAVIWFGALWSYVAIMAAVAKRDELTLFWKVNLAPLAVLGYLLDVSFNLTFGTLIYAELPHELLFTDRSKRHKAGDGRRKRIAEWFCRNLNVIDPEHC